MYDPLFQKALLKGIFFSCGMYLYFAMVMIATTATYLMGSEINRLICSFNLFVPNVFIPGWVLIFIGIMTCFSLILMWMGIISNNSETKIKAISYLVTTLIFTVGFGVTVNMILLRSTVHENENLMKTAMSMYENDTRLSADIDSLQKSLSCCGISGYSDWLVNKKLEGTLENEIHWTHKIPLSCYEKEDDKHSIHPNGCLEMAVNHIRDARVTILVFMVILAFIELIGIGIGIRFVNSVVIITMTPPKVPSLYKSDAEDGSCNSSTELLNTDKPH